MVAPWVIPALGTGLDFFTNLLGRNDARSSASREHGAALEAAPKYFDEERRQASESWLGEDPVARNVQAAQISGRIEALRGEGATLPEALGQGGGGGGGGPSAMLGNGPQKAAGRMQQHQYRTQMSQTAAQMEMQRRELSTRESIADKNRQAQFGPTSAASRQAAVAEGGLKIRQYMQEAEKALKVNLGHKAYNEIATSHISFVIDKITATMHPDNIRGTLLAKAAAQDGVGIFEQGRMDPKKLWHWIDQIRAQGSKTITEIIGIEDWTTKQFEDVLEWLLQDTGDLQLDPFAREKWERLKRRQE